MTGRQLVRARRGVRAEPLAPPDGARPHVAMLAAGVCGTDIQIAARQRGDIANVLGHEGVGVLRGVNGAERLVVFNPVDLRDQDAILGHSFDGVFRSWVPVGPELPLAALQEVEPFDPVALLTLCEPLGTVLYSWELIGHSDTPLAVGIWGAGPLGVLHAGFAVDRGHDVELVHPHASRLEWVRRQPFGSALRCSIAGSRGERTLDVAVMCAPKPKMSGAVREAADALAPGGLMVLAAGLDEAAAAGTFADTAVGLVRRRNACGHIDGRRGTIPVRTLDGKTVRVTGHRGTSLAQLRAADRLIRSDPARFRALVTHELRPEQAPELINARCAGRSRDDRGAEIVKIVVHFGPDGVPGA
jgi:threonine dehydrogenase-like Zn-dependent dehydrogenase